MKTEGLRLEEAGFKGCRSASSQRRRLLKNSWDVSVFIRAEVLDGAEICAGTGMLCRVVQLYHGLIFPGFDIKYWKAHDLRPTINNPLDMLGKAGFVCR